MNIVVRTMNVFYELVESQYINEVEGTQLKNIASSLNISTLDIQKIINILIERDMVMIFGGDIFNGRIGKNVYIRLTNKAFEYYNKKQ